MLFTFKFLEFNLDEKKYPIFAKPTEGCRLWNCQLGSRGRRSPDPGHCEPQWQWHRRQADPRAEGAQ